LRNFGEQALKKIKLDTESEAEFRTYIEVLSSFRPQAFADILRASDIQPGRAKRDAVPEYAAGQGLPQQVPPGSCYNVEVIAVPLGTPLLPPCSTAHILSTEEHQEVCVGSFAPSKHPLVCWDQRKHHNREYFHLGATAV
jgi:hypothetical protein